MMKRLFLFLAAVLMLPTAALAAGGDHGGDIPAMVGWQAINFALYAALLYFVLRKPVMNYFKSRVESYNSSLKKAQESREAAESKKREIQTQLSVLESTSDSSIANAKKEASALIAQMQKQAEEFSRKLKDEANRAVAIEVEKAKVALRRDLLEQSVAMAEKMLQDKMAEPDQKRLQTEFVDKIREAN